MFKSRFGFGVVSGLVLCGAPVALGSGPIVIETNDSCVLAEIIYEGVTPFTTMQATPDGPPLCEAGADIWYWYVPPRGCIVRVSTCGSLFDTFLGVYEDVGCPATDMTVISCSNDGFCDGVFGNQSTIEFEAECGKVYLFRVGGRFGAQGDGVLTVETDIIPIPCDWDGDNRLDSEDYFMFLDDFFAGTADFNMDQRIDSEDYFAFLDCFFNTVDVCPPVTKERP